MEDEVEGEVEGKMEGKVEGEVENKVENGVEVEIDRSSLYSHKTVGIHASSFVYLPQ